MHHCNSLYIRYLMMKQLTLLRIQQADIQSGLTPSFQILLHFWGCAFVGKF